MRETLAADPQRNGLGVAQECDANAAKRKRMSGIPPANDASDQGGVILQEVEATVPKQRPSLAVGSDSSARLVSGSSSKELLQPVAAKSEKPEIVHISTEVCKGRPDCRSTTTENGRSECEEEQLVKKPEQVSMRYKNSGNSHYNHLCFNPFATSLRMVLSREQWTHVNQGHFCCKLCAILCERELLQSMNLSPLDSVQA
jgi:hypothetical protein